MKSKTRFIFLLAVIFVFQFFQVAYSQGGLITVAKVEQRDFSPIQGEQAKILFSLSRDAKVSLKIFDPDNNMVAVPMDDRECSKGLNSVFWDGRNLDGDIVADVSYYFTLEAIDSANVKETYNPVTFSGGAVVQVSSLDAEGGIAYVLPEDAMVRIRIGVSKGPLLKTLVDWSPRRAGEHFEPWDGKDDSGVIQVSSSEHTVDIQAYSLHENSLLTSGSGKGLSQTIVTSSTDSASPGGENARMGIQQRKRLLVKKVVAGESSKPEVHSHYTQTKATNRAPRFAIRVESGSGEKTKKVMQVMEAAPPLKQAAAEVIAAAPDTVSGTVSLTMDLEELSGLILSNTRYEVITYVDNEFYMEDEQGYHPYTFELDTSELADGNHTVTFNIATLTDQVGSGSINITVKNN
ncbi:MAG: hypothetical protein GY702_03295 [Desulfobulbaceae bacterium]|nr:hypothetical protein [Desulfobulbaceae bacterium]